MRSQDRIRVERHGLLDYEASILPIPRLERWRSVGRYRTRRGAHRRAREHVVVLEGVERDVQLARVDRAGLRLIEPFKYTPGVTE